MKNLVIAFVLSFCFLLTGCGQKPMTDADMAQKYGLSLEEYQEQKEAAARMNMNIEDHLNMGDMDAMDHGDMDSEVDDMEEHRQAAEAMGMTLEEHIEAGHVGH
ncbi:MAG TPA: hypothetical protein VIT68_04020 [Candidatus Gracilibacteria bacterium]